MLFENLVTKVYLPGEWVIDFFKGLYSVLLKFMTMMKEKNRDGGIQNVEVRNVCRSDCTSFESDRRGEAEAAIAGISERSIKPVVSFKMRLAFVLLM